MNHKGKIRTSRNLREKRKNLKPGEALLIPFWMLLIASIILTTPALLTFTSWKWPHIIVIIYTWIIVFALLWIQAKRLEVQANITNPYYQKASQNIPVWKINEKKGLK